MKRSFVKGLAVICLTIGVQLFANPAMAFDFAYDNQDWSEVGYFSPGLRDAGHDFPDGDGAIYFDVYPTDCDSPDEYHVRYHSFLTEVDDDPYWRNIVGFRFDINLQEHLDNPVYGMEIQPFIIVVIPDVDGDFRPDPLWIYGSRTLKGKARRAGEFYTYEHIIDKSEVPDGSTLLGIGVRVRIPCQEDLSGQIYLDNVGPIYLWNPSPTQVDMNPDLLKFIAEHDVTKLVSKADDYKYNGLDE